MTAEGRPPTFEEWHAISSRLLLYATAIDTQEFERLGEVFATELVADYRAFELSGSAAMVDMMRRSHRGLRTQHAITNITIEVSLDGRAAWTTCYGTNRIRRPGQPDSLYEMGARYVDQLALTPDGWRIVRRTARGMWERGQSPPPDPED